MNQNMPPPLFRQFTVSMNCNQCQQPYQDHYSITSQPIVCGNVCVPCFDSAVNNIARLQQIFRNRLANRQ